MRSEYIKTIYANPKNNHFLETVLSGDLTKKTLYINTYKLPDYIDREYNSEFRKKNMVRPEKVFLGNVTLMDLKKRKEELSFAIEGGFDVVYIDRFSDLIISNRASVRKYIDYIIESAEKSKTIVYLIIDNFHNMRGHYIAEYLNEKNNLK